jgi:hypothetical protein
MTKKDVLGSNEDLIRRAARILIRKPIYSLSSKTLEPADGTRRIVVTAQSKITPPDILKNISRVDISINGRPYRSLEAVEGAIRARSITLKESGKKKLKLLLEARDGANKLVAVYRRAL